MHPSTAPDAQTKNKKPRGYVGVMTVADLKRTLGNARGMMPNSDAAESRKMVFAAGASILVFRHSLKHYRFRRRALSGQDGGQMACPRHRSSSG